jgi:hypothetical protein
VADAPPDGSAVRVVTDTPHRSTNPLTAVGRIPTDDIDGPGLEADLTRRGQHRT